MRIAASLLFVLIGVAGQGQNPFSARGEGIAPDSVSQWRESLKNDGSHHLHLRPYSPLHNQFVMHRSADSSALRSEISAGLVFAGGYGLQSGLLGTAAPMATVRFLGGKKFYAEGSYLYWMERLPGHVERFADSTGVIPGIGWRNDLGDISGAHLPQVRIIYKPSKFFEFEAGRGRNFWGDGYRSLFLGDHVSPYPYLRINTRVWRAQFTNLYTYMRDVSGQSRFRDGRTKFMSMHALSWNISRDVNFSVYEMVIWQTSDTLSNRGFEFNYLNPFVLYRPLEFTQGSADNVMLGASLTWQVTKKVRAYSQLMLDEFLLEEIRAQRGWWANKFAVQWGVKWHELAGMPLHFQTEWNLCRPFTYTHGSSLQGYGHLGQSAAHPMGSNFFEWVSLVTYQKPRADFRAEFIRAIYGRDRDGKNWGGNVFSSYANPSRIFFNEIGQGNRHRLHLAHLGANLRPWNNQDIGLSLSCFYRFDRDDFRKEEDLYFQFGLNLPLVPHLRDF